MLFGGRFRRRAFNVLAGLLVLLDAAFRERYVNCQLEHVLDHAGQEHDEQLAGLFEAGVGVDFDQPGVELYKNNMFSLLDKPGFEKGK